MGRTAFERWAGLAGMVGGALWVVATTVHALRPLGCVADECSRRPMRQSSALEGILTLAALVLFAVAAAALIVLVRRAGRFGRGGKVGTLLAVGGVVILIVASAIQALVYDGDFPQMPYFVIPGLIALVVGVGTLAVVVLRAGVLPRWASASLLVGTIALVGSNEQTQLAWLALPFGLAWMAVGWALWSHGSRQIGMGARRP